MFLDIQYWLQWHMNFKLQWHGYTNDHIPPLFYQFLTHLLSYPWNEWKILTNEELFKEFKKKIIKNANGSKGLVVF